MRRNSFLKCCLIFLSSVLCCQAALACMYGPPYKTVCQNYTLASSIIVGKIESVETKGYAQKVVISVKQTYKGKSESRIVLDQPLSTCDWDFSDNQGETLLLYLWRNKKTQAYSAIAEGAGGNIARVSEEFILAR